MTAFSVLDKPADWTIAGPRGDAEEVFFDAVFTASTQRALKIRVFVDALRAHVAGASGRSAAQP